MSDDFKSSSYYKYYMCIDGELQYNIPSYTETDDRNIRRARHKNKYLPTS